MSGEVSSLTTRSSPISLVMRVFSSTAIFSSSQGCQLHKAKIVGFRPPAAQLDFRHNLGNALGANHPGVFGAGDTLLRLRHAAARRGCREQGQHDEAASPDWLLNLLHGQLSRRLAVSACHGTASGNGRARAALAISGAIPALCLGSGPAGLMPY